MKKPRNLSIPLLLAAIVATIYLGACVITSLISLLSNLQTLPYLLDRLALEQSMKIIYLILNLLSYILVPLISALGILLLTVALWINAFKPARILLVVGPALFFVNFVLNTIVTVLSKITLASAGNIISTMGWATIVDWLSDVCGFASVLLLLLTVLFYAFRKTRLLAKIGGGATILAELAGFAISWVVTIVNALTHHSGAIAADLLVRTLLMNIPSFIAFFLFVATLALLWLGILFDKREKQKRLVFEMPVQAEPTQAPEN